MSIYFLSFMMNVVFTLLFLCNITPTLIAQAFVAEIYSGRLSPFDACCPNSAVHRPLIFNQILFHIPYFFGSCCRKAMVVLRLYY